MPDIKAGLYVVATPIGTASDVTLRALSLISKADVLVAEDKRNLLKLMQIHEIQLAGRPLISYHDYNAQEQRPKILTYLKNKNSVVLVSDAGTPLVADPGYRLVSEAVSNGFYVSGAPGPCAILAALMISGLPTDKFFFGGFVPTKIEAKRTFFSKYLNLPSTIVLYESASRLGKTLEELCKVCEHERNIVVCRELTKKFEDVQRGTLKEVAAHFSMAARVKGEIVLLLGPGQPEALTGLKIENIIIDAMKFMSFKDSVNFVSKHLNISKKIVYKRALEIKNIT